jgi:hypothetical protein
VGCLPPFGGPAEVLCYLARYTHRVAISNSRLVALNDNGVTFKWKDYRLKGQERYGVMTLDTHEFIRRFLMHVLPQGFHGIRYFGLLTGPTRANNIARIRELLAVPLIPIDAIKAATTKPEEPEAPQHPCPCCGNRMRIIETSLPGQQPKHRPTPLPAKIRIEPHDDNLRAIAPKSRSPVCSLLSRPQLRSLQCYLHHATASPVFTDTHLAVKPLDDTRRRLSGCRDPLEGTGLEAWHELADCRRMGEFRPTHRTGNGEGAQPAGTNMRDRSGHKFEHNLHIFRYPEE